MEETGRLIEERFKPANSNSTADNTPLSQDSPGKPEIKIKIKTSVQFALSDGLRIKTDSD